MTTISWCLQGTWTEPKSSSEDLCVAPAWPQLKRAIRNRQWNGADRKLKAVGLEVLLTRRSRLSVAHHSREDHFSPVCFCSHSPTTQQKTMLETCPRKALPSPAPRHNARKQKSGWFLSPEASPSHIPPSWGQRWPCPHSWPQPWCCGVGTVPSLAEQANCWQRAARRLPPGRYFVLD